MSQPPCCPGSSMTAPAKGRPSCSSTASATGARPGTRSWTCWPSGTRSIRLDLAGFGESPAYAAGTPYTMENACADLAANFAEWGVERPHVVGNSLGGAISLELAARGLVSSATVLSPAGFFGRVDRLWPWSRSP